MAALSVGIVLLIISLCIFLSTLLMHCHTHFRLRCCIRSKSPFGSSKDVTTRESLRIHQKNLMRQINNKESICRCCLAGVDNNFDFFPVAFLLYNIYVIFVTILIVCKYLYDDNDNNKESMFGHTGNILVANTNNHNYNKLINWIIVYSLIILSIWECLFNFYRFYSTYFASRKIIILNPQQIIFKFTLFFAIPFFAIFVIQIHYYYYLYPIIIFVYFFFNIINVWLFGHILIVQYRFVMG